MKTQMTNRARVLLAILLFLFSVIVFGAIIAPAGFSVAEAGKDMTRLRSVGGNSVAEAYYQLHGEVYYGLGNIIACIGVALCLGGCFCSGWVLTPVFCSNKTKIDMFTTEVKDRITRATQELSKPASNASSIDPGDVHDTSVTVHEAEAEGSSESLEETKCSKCGEAISEDSRFCTKCGTPVAQLAEQKVCPSCGKPIFNESAFCTKCGHKL